MSKDLMHKLTNWIDHNRGQFFGILIPAVVLIVLLFAGCSKTQSIADPTQKVDRQGFLIEAIAAEQQLKQETIDIEALLQKHNTKIETYNLKKDTGLADLDSQDQRNQRILEITGGALTEYASGGTFTPIPLLLSLLNVAGIGWGLGNKYDNMRKDKVILEQKTTA